MRRLDPMPAPARQLTFPGVDVDPHRGMTYKDKAALVLDQYPDARDNDNVFTLRCLWEFDGLHRVIDAETYRKLLAWARSEQVTAFETWRRRRQEIQRNRTGSGYLRPSPDVEAYRRRHGLVRERVAFCGKPGWRPTADGRMRFGGLGYVTVHRWKEA